MGAHPKLLRILRPAGILHQRAGRHFQSTGEAQDRRQPGLARATLETADRCRMQLGPTGQLVLRQPALLTRLA